MARRSKERSGTDGAVIRAVVEGLERRCLLSGGSPAFGEVAQVEWNGLTVDAIVGEWVVSLKYLPPTRDSDGAVVQFNDRWSTAHTPNAEIAPFMERLAGQGIRFGRYLGAEDAFTIETPTDAAWAELDAVLKSLPDFVAVEPNAVFRPASTTPNDTDFSDQYALHNTGQTGGTSDADIDAPEAWDLSTGSPNVVVAVLDSGVYYNHEDLIANRWRNTNEVDGNSTDDDGNGYTDDYYGYDAYDGQGTPLDVDGHGTLVAGVIAAVGDNSTGISGAAWDITILPVKVTNDTRNSTEASVTAGINYVNKLRDDGANVRVINQTYVGPPGGYFSGIASAITRAADRDVLFVAAAGNWGDGDDAQPWDNDATGHAIYPSSYTNDNIISVAGTDDDDAMGAFSNWGTTSVDLAAPGDSIWTTRMNDDGNGLYGSVSGTSVAAPLVSGVAALAFSMKPDLTYTQVRSAILGNVDTIGGLSTKVATGGRLNAYNTLNYIKTQYRPQWKRVVIGDAGGVKKTDYFNVRVVPGDSSTTEVRISGDGQTWTQYTTVSNTASYEIAIFPLAGTDHVTVESGVNNRIYVNGGDDADSVLTEAAADSLYGGGGNDTLDGYSGDDVIYGDWGNDTLYGQGGADYIDAGTGDDWVSGSGSADTIYGSGGNDTLYAGTGSDSVYGGAGNDVFHTSGDPTYVDTGSGDEGTDDILDIDSVDVISQG